MKNEYKILGKEGETLSEFMTSEVALVVDYIANDWKKISKTKVKRMIDSGGVEIIEADEGQNIPNKRITVDSYNYLIKVGQIVRFGREYARFL